MNEDNPSLPLPLPFVPWFMQAQHHWMERPREDREAIKAYVALFDPSEAEMMYSVFGNEDETGWMWEVTYTDMRVYKLSLE